MNARFCCKQKHLISSCFCSLLLAVVIFALICQGQLIKSVPPEGPKLVSPPEGPKWVSPRKEGGQSPKGQESVPWSTEVCTLKNQSRFPQVPKSLLRRTKVGTLKYWNQWSSKVGTPKYKSHYPEVPKLAPWSTKVHTPKYQSWYPEVPNLVPWSTKVGTPKYQSQYPEVPKSVPQSTKVGSPKYQSRFPEVPKSVPWSSKVATPKYHSWYPEVPKSLHQLGFNLGELLSLSFIGDYM